MTYEPRVLQLLPSLDPAFGGPVASARSVAAAYARFAHVQTVSSGRPDSRWADQAVLAFRSWSVGPRATAHVLAISPGLLLRVLRSVRGYDLVHIHFNRSVGSLLACCLVRLSRRPYVVQTHGMCAPWTGPKAIVDKLFTKRLLRGANVVLVLSDREAGDLRRAFGARTARMFNALDAQDKRRSRDSSAIKTVLFCARLHPRKGLDTFVRVVAKIQQVRPLQAVIVGNDEGAKQPAERLAAELNAHLVFTGSLAADAVLDRMRDADVLIHPAPGEPFGMSMVEAMSLGLPVVAARSSELAPLFAKQGAAMLVDDQDVDAWVEAVLRILKTPSLADSLSLAGAELVKQEFSIDGLSQRLSRIAQELIKP